MYCIYLIPRAGGQASKADPDIREGDLLLSIDGTSTVDIDYGKLIDYIRSTTEAVVRPLLAHQSG